MKDEEIYKNGFIGTIDEVEIYREGKPLFRTFGENSGVRDTDKEKIDFEGFIDPLVIQKFGEYMHKNRKLADGSFRDSDNWQKLFGEKHFDVCMKSGWRHFFDWWMYHRGNKAREGIDDAICGLMFNVMAYYRKILLDREQDKNSR